MLTYMLDTNICIYVMKNYRRADNLTAIERFVACLDVLAFEAKAAAYYGQVRAELERAGAPCGPHDMQIGGSCPQRGADRRDQ